MAIKIYRSLPTAVAIRPAQCKIHSPCRPPNQWLDRTKQAYFCDSAFVGLLSTGLPLEISLVAALGQWTWTVLSSICTYVIKLAQLNERTWARARNANDTTQALSSHWPNPRNDLLTKAATSTMPFLSSKGDQGRGQCSLVICFHLLTWVNNNNNKNDRLLWTNFGFLLRFLSIVIQHSLR